MKKQKSIWLKISNSDAVKNILQNRRRLFLLAAIIVVVPAVLFFAFGGTGDKKTYRYQMNEIRRTAFAGSIYDEILKGMQKSSPMPIYAVFVSVSDGKSSARVTASTGKTLAQAWENAYKSGENLVSKYNIKTKWVRADIVNTTDIVTEESLRGKYLKEHPANSFRYGLAFDDDYNSAVLAEEINAHDIIDYDNGNTFSVNRLNDYLQSQKRQAVKIMPDKIRVFTTVGFVFDDGNTYTLMHDKYNMSVREANVSQDKRKIENIKSTIAKELLESMTSEGQFSYYISPIDHKTYKDDYLGAEHAKAVSALIEQYKAEPGDDLKSGIEKAVAYLKKCIVKPNKESAFIKDPISMTQADENEVYLGDTALAASALIDYIETFGERGEDTEKLLKSLMNGVYLFFDEESGSFEHTLLYPSLEPDDCVRDEQYNSMAAYAMCRMYKLTGEQTWIDGAAAAVNKIIETDSYKSGVSKWLMLSLKYLGDYTGDGEYYMTALDYMDGCIPQIADGTNFSPEYEDFLMTGYEVFVTCEAQQQFDEYTQSFDMRSFVLTAVNYTDFMFNKYYYPENAMYFDNAEDIVNNFFSSDKNFTSNAGVAQGYLYSLNRYYIYCERIAQLYAMLK